MIRRNADPSIRRRLPRRDENRQMTSAIIGAKRGIKFSLHRSPLPRSPLPRSPSPTSTMPQQPRLPSVSRKRKQQTVQKDEKPRKVGPPAPDKKTTTPASDPQAGILRARLLALQGARDRMNESPKREEPSGTIRVEPHAEQRNVAAGMGEGMQAESSQPPAEWKRMQRRSKVTPEGEGEKDAAGSTDEEDDSNKVRASRRVC